jgi:hypothetical protein
VVGRLKSLLYMKTRQRPGKTQRQVDECLEGAAAIQHNRRTVTTVAENHNDLTVQKLTHFIFNPLNAELNPICFLLALFGAHLILHVSR